MLGVADWTKYEAANTSIAKTPMGGCQNYGPFLGTPKYQVLYYNGDPKRDHNLDNHPYV